MNFISRLSIHINRLLLTRAKNGPYRFLIKNIEKITTLRLAEKILSTEYFKDILVPIELQVENWQSILVIAPHQDDETIGAGGALVKAKAAGARIHIAYITDGGLINYPGGIDKSIKVRFNEAEKVCDYLNAEIHKIGISNYEPIILENHIQKLAILIKNIQPDLIFIPWMLDSPPKHRLANHMLAVVQKLNHLNKIEVWGYQVHNMLPANGYIDITSQVSQKKELLNIYKSQNDLYCPYNHSTIGMNAWNSRFLSSELQLSEPKYVEIFFTLPINEYCKLVGQFYEMDLNDTYGSDPKTLQGVKKWLNLL